MASPGISCNCPRGDHMAPRDRPSKQRRAGVLTFVELTSNSVPLHVVASIAAAVLAPARKASETAAVQAGSRAAAASAATTVPNMGMTLPTSAASEIMPTQATADLTASAMLAVALAASLTALLGTPVAEATSLATCSSAHMGHNKRV